MKVALNPAELRPIVDALDDTHQIQLQSGGGLGVGIKKLGLQPAQCRPELSRNSPLT